MDKKRSRDESVEETVLDVDLPEVKRLRENLFNGLDDDESEFCTQSLELDSFMKSFEEEIAPSPSTAEDAAEVFAVDQTLYSGESRPELGYLLEASDDELGIPPPPARINDEITDELARVDSDSSDFGGEFWEIPSFDDTFGIGFGLGEPDNSNCEYVELGGLFDRSDSGVGSGEFSCQPGTLPSH